MYRKVCCLFIFLFICSAFPSLIHADNQTVFGPKSFEIGNWHIHASVHTFNVEDSGEGVVTITKNTTDMPISSGFILLNTTLVPLRNFLIGDEVVFEKEITLRSINFISVFLLGTPGASVAITINSGGTPALPPEVLFSANPQTIMLGESSTLAWNVIDADTISIDPGIGSVGASGSTQVSPTDATTYTITATGLGGTTSADVTITVTDPNAPPTVTVTPASTVITQGETITLTWNSERAQSAFIDNGVGSIAVNGSTTVSPSHTTTYTITVNGPTGSNSAQAKIQVTGNPALLPEGSFGKQYEDLIPFDATVDEYDTKRFSLITGLVRSIDNSPIPDVSVSLHGHPEYGTVSTDTQGRFSLPIEGGTTLTVVYQKDGFITAHRKVYVPWNDIAIAETIQMIAQDLLSTTVTFDGNPDTVVTHQSTQITDEFGSRSATMVFTGDNHAYLVDENGNDVHELTTITTRATEYTNPESMPAILPPTSAYTYCAELSVDGAQRVRFEKPVITWVDNFLGFDVGEIVPVGYYDRDRGVWVPSDNGVVVKLLDTDADGIVDALDANGDDEPDDLNSNGSFSDEVTGLNDAGAYQPDSTFWRVAVTHFTPWDCNWPYGPPADAIPPNPETIPTIDQQIEEQKDCQSHNNSFVEERSRIFHEDIPIPGTDITLHYASNRVEGYKTVVSVPCSGETTPASLKNIIVKVEVAGRILEQVLDPLPNQKAEFIWDGVDHLGRPISGSVTAHISVGFLFDAVYYRASNFAQAGNEITAIRTRKEVISWKRSNLTVYSEVKGKGIITEGWTFSLHHQIIPVNLSTLYKGDGTIIKNNIYIIKTVAGNGNEGYSGDNGLAKEASLYVPQDVAVDSFGNLYIADSWNSRIRKVDINGIITTVAGNETPGFSGDGGLATEASLRYPYGVAVDSTGNLYIADLGNLNIRKVATNGIITTVAGNGIQGYDGDGGPATEASFIPFYIAVDSSGNLYITDYENLRIRKVDTSGIITTVAGNGTLGFSGDGGPATEASLFWPRGVAVDSSGNLYIADSANYRIRKVDISGIITTVAGSETPGFSGDGGPATEASLYSPYGVTVDSTGNLFIASFSNNRIRKVDTSGIIATIVGSGCPFYCGGFSGDGGLPTEASLRHPYGVAVDSSGNLYIADTENNRIRKVAPPAVFNDYMISGDIPFAEKNGLGHIMTSDGLQKTTIDLDTGAILRKFEYDENNKLISITDQFGNQTSINRDGSGMPTSITSPDGLTTQLTIDAANHLTRITLFGWQFLQL